MINKSVGVHCRVFEALIIATLPKATAASKCIEKGAYEQRAQELPVDKSDR